MRPLSSPGRHVVFTRKPVAAVYTDARVMLVLGLIHRHSTAERARAGYAEALNLREGEAASSFEAALDFLLENHLVEREVEEQSAR